MLRRLVLLSLTLSAISIATVGGIGYLSPVHFDVSGSSRSYGYLNLTDGLIRLYMYRGSDDFHVRTSHSQRRFSFLRDSDDTLLSRIQHARRGVLPDYALVSSRFGPRGGTAGATIRMFGVRFTTIAPIAILMIYPLIAVVRDAIRRRRPKPGTCTECGYDLTGNESGICPECGSDCGKCAKCGYDLTGNESGVCPECGQTT